MLITVAGNVSPYGQIAHWIGEEKKCNSKITLNLELLVHWSETISKTHRVP
jgi:hypothetical protein